MLFEVLLEMFQLPTVVFSIGMGMVTFYWMFVIVGALDIDIFDGLFHLGDTIEGAAHGAHGAAEGTMGVLSNFSMALRLGKIPITVVGSFLTFYSWMICMMGMHYLAEFGSLALIGSVVTLGGLIGAFFLTSLTLRPLEPIFETAEARGQETLIGKVCVVTTGKVTSIFGQARCDDDVIDLILQVRHDVEGAFKRNDRGLIIDFDKEREAFLIEPLDPMLRDRS